MDSFFSKKVLFGAMSINIDGIKLKTDNVII